MATGFAVGARTERVRPDGLTNRSCAHRDGPRSRSGVGLAPGHTSHREAAGGTPLRHARRAGTPNRPPRGRPTSRPDELHIPEDDAKFAGCAGIHESSAPERLA